MASSSHCFRIAALLVTLTTAASADSHFSLPGETFTKSDRTRLTELNTTLDQKQLSTAATLLDALLSEDGEKLMAMPESKGALISVSAWADSLPRAQKLAIEAAYRDKFDAAIAQQLETMKRDSRVGVDALYNLARRHRFCPAAAAAYAEAADRAIDDGDLPTAHALYQLALRGGWTADEARSPRIELLRRLDEGALISLTSENKAKPFAGVIPFDAAWFNTNNPAPRYLPIAGDDHIFINGPTGAAAFREGGQVIWSNPTPPMRTATSRPAARGATTWQPALLSDIYGRGQILITRQLTPQSDPASDNYILRASRAADGRPVWSSDSQPLLKDFSFAGAPAVAGRYIYALALAVQEGAERATLSLVALDTLGGQLRWQATLGSFIRARDSKDSVKPWDPIWSQSEPLVAGDAVYVSPGCGVIACIGRLDGKIRWLHAYDSTEAPPLRWRGTPVLCGTVLIAAPLDATEALGLDAATGKSIWSTKPDAPTLIGRTATTAIFAGPQFITALSARDGHPGWKWEPLKTVRITGPAVVNNDLVLVPTSAPITTLHAEDGTVAEREATGIPFFRRALNADVAKRAMEDLGAGKSFGQ